MKQTFANQGSAPEYIIVIHRDRIGCRTLSPYDSSLCLSKEHSLYSCGSLVLHVWKHVSISVQREGRAGMSELLRNNFWRHSGRQRDCGRRVAQIIEPDSWHTGKVKYRSEMLGEIIGIDWLPRRRSEDQVTGLWVQIVRTRFRVQIMEKGTIQLCNLIGRRLRNAWYLRSTISHSVSGCYEQR